jgi:hypothetical protein
MLHTAIRGGEGDQWLWGGRGTSGWGEGDQWLWGGRGTSGWGEGDQWLWGGGGPVVVGGRGTSGWGEGGRRGALVAEGAYTAPWFYQ